MSTIKLIKTLETELHKYRIPRTKEEKDKKELLEFKLMELHNIRIANQRKAKK